MVMGKSGVSMIMAVCGTAMFRSSGEEQSNIQERGKDAVRPVAPGKMRDYDTPEGRTGRNASAECLGGNRESGLSWRGQFGFSSPPEGG